MAFDAVSAAQNADRVGMPLLMIHGDEDITARYLVDRLLWYEVHPDIESAIAREKRIKGGPRWRKERLIEEMNPDRTLIRPLLVVIPAGTSVADLIGESR